MKPKEIISRAEEEILELSLTELVPTAIPGYLVDAHSYTRLLGWCPQLYQVTWLVPTAIPGYLVGAHSYTRLLGWCPQLYQVTWLVPTAIPGYLVGALPREVPRQLSCLG